MELLKKYSDFGGGKKKKLIQSVCHADVKFWKKKFALSATKKINIITLPYYYVFN
jgi:hypothetical protein